MAEPEPEPEPEPEDAYPTPAGEIEEQEQGGMEEEEEEEEEEEVCDHDPTEVVRESINKWIRDDWDRRKHHRWDEQITNLGKLQENEAMDYYANVQGTVSCRLTFDPAQKLRPGCAKVLAEVGRWQPPLGKFAEVHGIKHYCWITPNENIGSDGGQPYVPCEHGGFAYSFAENPEADHAENCVFNVGAKGTDDSLDFPNTLAPLSVLPLALRPSVDLTELTYSVSTDTARELRGLGVGSCITGKLSPVAEVTLPPDARIQARIPESATHFVWAYAFDWAGADSDTIDTKIRENKLSEAEASFLTVGSYIYLEAGTDGIANTAKVAGVNAVGVTSLVNQTARSNDPSARREFTVHVASWNVGNAPPPSNLHPWVPSGGSGADIIVVCGQEAVYDKSKTPKERPLGRLSGVIMSAEFGSGSGSKGTTATQPYCLLSVLGAKAKVQEEARTWKQGGDGTRFEWNAAFHTYFDKPQKTDKETKRGSALPWLDVYGSTQFLQLTVKDDIRGKDPILGEGRIPIPLTDLFSKQNLQDLQDHNIQADPTRVPDGRQLAQMYDGREVTVELMHGGSQIGTAMVQLQYTELQSNHAIAAAKAQSMILQNAMKAAVKDNKKNRSGKVVMTIKRADGLPAADWGNTSDPYCSIEVVREGGRKENVGKTRTVKQSLHPVWNHSITIDTDVTTSAIRLLLKDEDVGSADDLLGTCYLPMDFLDDCKKQTGVVLDVTTPQGSRLGQLYLDLQFQPTASSDAGSHRPQNKRSGGLKSCCGSRPGSHNSSRQAEVTYVEPVRKDPFFDTVHKTVGEMYEIVGKGMGDKNALYKEWGEMRLIILARREVLPFISGTEVATEATGLGGVYHNKGGIVAKLELQGISVCFACSHLAAHEGVKHCEDRNRHAAEIQEAARVGSQTCDLSNQFDHLIWAGDFNYRQEKREWWAHDTLLDTYKNISNTEKEIETLRISGDDASLTTLEAGLAKLRQMAERQLEELGTAEMDRLRFDGVKSKVAHEEKLDDIKHLMATRDWEQLEANDELAREMKAGRVFAGFTDALDFQADVGGRGLMPTFKMQRKKLWSNLSQRVPSFCDRVVYRSAPGAAGCLKLDTFSAAPSLITSDHKPVFARFKLSVPPPMPKTMEQYLEQHRSGPEDPVTYAAVRFSNINILGLEGVVKEACQTVFLEVRSFQNIENPLFIREEVCKGTSHYIPCLRSGSGWASLDDASFIMRTVVPSTDIMEMDAGPSATYSPSILLSIRQPKSGSPRESDQVQKEKAAAEDDWQLLDKNGLKDGRLRAGQSKTWASRGYGAVDTGTELGFGQLALRMREDEHQAVEEAEPGLTPLGSCLLEGERLRSSPGTELLEWYSVRNFEVALSLNGISVGVSRKIGASAETGSAARVTGRIEVFDLQRGPM